MRARPGMERMSWRWRAGMLKTEICDLESGIEARFPWRRGCDEMALMPKSLQTGKRILLRTTLSLGSSTFYQGSIKASGIITLIGT